MKESISVLLSFWDRSSSIKLSSVKFLQAQVKNVCYAFLGFYLGVTSEVGFGITDVYSILHTLLLAISLGGYKQLQLQERCLFQHPRLRSHL